MIRRRTILVLAALGATAVVIPLAVDAATPKKGAFYGAKVPLAGLDTGDPTVRIRVAANGKTLDVMGPHGHCHNFTLVEYFYPKVDDVKIKPDGSFRGSTSYVQHSFSAYHHYEFIFKVRVQGRFVSADTAKGSFWSQMTVDGTRNVGGPSQCPPQSVASFKAKRGNVVGFKAAKMPSRTKWHPEGEVPSGGNEEP